MDCINLIAFNVLTLTALVWTHFLIQGSGKVQTFDFYFNIHSL